MISFHPNFRRPLREKATFHGKKRQAQLSGPSVATLEAGKGRGIAWNHPAIIIIIIIIIRSHSTMLVP